ncbi:MAG: helix-turn-helix domain-containing protein [Mycobacterium sp.]
MVATTERPLRADAARNAERILRAAREVYAELGPDAPIDVVAQRAEVGERTLYRRFPSKGELVRAALDQSIGEHLSPVLERVLTYSDPLRGITELIEAATHLGAREHNLLVAGRKTDALANIWVPMEVALADLVVRGQQAGQVRADLAAEDLPRLVIMLNSVLWTMDPDGDGWRRYVVLVLDAISTAAPSALPAVVPLRMGPSPESWPL